MKKKLNKLKKALETLSEYNDGLPDFDCELPDFSFNTNGKTAKITLYSATLNTSRSVDFWKYVDEIGGNNGNNYHPKSIEFWIDTFKEAASRLERDLKYRKARPEEWIPLEDSN